MHILQPKHIKLNKEETEKVLNKLNVSKAQLPKILLSDPALPKDCQVGDLIKCDNCGVTYSKDAIAKEKGGCNPGPIDADASVSDGQLVINLSDVEAIAYLF